MVFAAGLGAVWAIAAVGLAAQATRSPQKADVVAVAGCLGQEGEIWVLTRATEPLVPPRPAPSTASTEQGGYSATLAVTAQMAKEQSHGKERYRLTGFLKELNVASHKGHRVLVRGPLTTEGTEKRINLMSVTMVAEDCGLL